MRELRTSLLIYSLYRKQLSWLPPQFFPRYYSLVVMIRVSAPRARPPLPIAFEWRLFARPDSWSSFISRHYLYHGNIVYRSSFRRTKMNHFPRKCTDCAIFRKEVESVAKFPRNSKKRKKFGRYREHEGRGCVWRCISIYLLIA